MEQREPAVAKELIKATGNQIKNRKRVNGKKGERRISKYKLKIKAYSVCKI